MPSSVEIMRRHCSCAEHHHECGCCMAIKTHAFHKRIEANGKAIFFFYVKPL